MVIFKEIQDLIYQLNAWTKSYDEGHPEVSDKEWDDAFFKLVELENQEQVYFPDSPTQQINYQVVSKLNKVQHNHKMLSLDKTKDWNEFLNYFSNINSHKDVVGMIKLDGLTCSLRYLNGKLISAETRGNGEIGEDILHNAQVIKSIPKYITYKDELIVDGEIICTYEDFEPFKEEYKNPRNFAAGSIRLLDSKECESRNLTFVVWNVVKGYGKEKLLNKFHTLSYEGFIVTPWTSSFDWDAKDFLQDEAKKYGYPIDGLVGRFDDIEFGESLGETSHHTRAAYAFKFYDEEYETTLLDITYETSRTGEMTPVALFNPIDDGVSIIERASLHNLSIMKEILHSSSGWVGQKVWVVKQNQIIPQISKAELDDEYTKQYINIPNICPFCGQPTIIKTSDSGVKTLYCSNDNCNSKLINQLDHFCGKTGLDIKSLSKATLGKLIDWGWIKNKNDIFSLKNYRDEWKNKPGFGEKSVSNILSAIENSKNCELWRFISSLGIPLIGSTVAKDLANYFKCWGAFSLAIKNHFDFEQLPNFGSAISESIYSYNWSIADNLIKNAGLFIENVLEKSSPIDSELKNNNIVITGKLNIYKNRNALKEEIEKYGGKVVSSVSKNTKYLINNDNTSTSSKNLTAKKLGIPILTEQEFIEKFLK